MRKKVWNTPNLTILSNSSIQSGTGTRAYYEFVNFTVDNTCTYAGVECTTAEGITYQQEVTNVNNTLTYAGLVMTALCVSGIQCS